MMDIPTAYFLKKSPVLLLTFVLLDLSMVGLSRRLAEVCP
jgi:hypothetical protein